QDAITVGRAVGAGVHMDQLVARVRREAAAAFFHGTEAGGPGRPTVGEAGHGAPEELLHALRMAAQERPRPIAHGSGRLDAGQLVCPRVVADILRAEKRREAVAEELLIVWRRERDRAAGEVDDASLLQRVRPVAAVGLMQHEARERSTAAPLCVENHSVSLARRLRWLWLIDPPKA